MADLKISELSALAGSDLAAADLAAVVDSSASETKKITVSDLVQYGTSLISDSSIPGAKILFGSQQVAGSALVNGAVDTTQLADDAVTAAKIADEATVDLVTTLPASGAFTGQIALDTDDNKIYIWDGSAWQSVKAAGSINTVVGSSTGLVNISITTSGDEVTISTTLDDTTAAKHFLAGPAGSAGAVTYREITGTDLPTATTSTKGGVAVNGNGLVMSGSEIRIDNTVTAETVEYHLTQYDAKGLVTGGRVITATDLPEAGASTKGAVFPGSGLEVAAGGELNHTNSATPGDYAKVTVDAQGHVTAGTTLAESDIPSLDASKIASGALPSARIEDDAVTGAKVGDYAVSKFGEVQPTADHIGQFFFNPLTRDLFLWDGNVFQPVGISAGEIVLAGTYDASSNLLDSVTAEGSAAGFTNGASLPAADTGNNRYYVVVSQTGTGTAPAPTVTLEPPDILLSNGTSYVLIETSETITAQIASNVGFTPYGDIASTNVQGAIAELDDEKVSLAGDTMTGDLTLGAGVDLVYEGTSDNAFETTLTVADPTADNTVTIPNETGTVVTTGSSGVVTSTMITDGTIVNADISSSAEIAVSKLADGAARQLLQTNAAGTGVEWASDIDIPGTLDVAGATVLDGNLNVDSGTLYVDATNNRVGLGTSGPGFKLTIQDSTTPRIRIGDGVRHVNLDGGSATQNAAVGTDYAGSFGIYTNGATNTRLHIDSAGLVGIGTTSPTCELEIGGNGHIHLADQGRIGCRSATSSGAPEDAYVKFYDSDIISFHTTDTERLRITSDGKLGLGTSTVSGLFHAAGSSPDIIIQDTQSYTVSDGPLIQLQGRGPNATNYNFGYIRGVSSGSNNAGILQFATNSAGTQSVAMTIDSSQRVGIGTTSVSHKLDLLVGGGADGINVYNNATGAAYYQLATTSRSYKIEAIGSDLRFYDNTGSSERARIDSSGRLLVGTSTSRAMFGSVNNRVQIEGDGHANSSLSLTRTGGGAPQINLASSADTSFGLVSSGNDLGLITFMGADGTAMRNAAEIYAEVDGTPGAGDMPGRLVFATTADGASTPTERMTIKNDGKVGIGTASPTNLLHLSAAGTSYLQIQNTTAGNNFYVGNSTGSGIFELTGSNQFKFISNSSDRVVIDTSGRLLVGTSSSRAVGYGDNTSLLLEGTSYTKAAISAVLNSNDSSGPSLNFAKTRGTSNGSSTVVQDGDFLGLINFSGGDGTDLLSHGARIAAYVDGTPGANDMPGRLVFSTTASGASSPTERMRIQNTGTISSYADSGNPSLTLRNATSAGTSVVFIQGLYSASGTTSGGAASFYVFTNGDVQNTNNSYGAISDIKLKENIVDANSQWDDLKAIQVRNYNFIEGQTHTQIGVVAQEIETVSPGLVTESTDRDEDGNDLGTVTKSVNYSVLYMKAVKALQEAMERIETLEAKVAALEA